MKQWEYTLLTGGTDQGFFEAAAKLGLQGWEMVGISRGPGPLLGPDNGVLTAAFKRPLRASKAQAPRG